MSEGEIGVTVSVANPFNDTNTYYEENNNDLNNSNLGTYRYSQNDSNHINKNDSEINYNSIYRQEENMDNSINYTHNTKSSFSEKAKNKISEAGKPIIRFGQKLNAKFIQIFKL